MHHQGNDRISQHKSVDRTVQINDYAIAPMTVTEARYTSRAQCRDCDWNQTSGTIGAVKHHVLKHPGHQVTAQWAATETFQAQQPTGGSSKSEKSNHGSLCR